MGNISNGAFVTNKILSASILEMGIEYAIQTFDFILITCCGVFTVLRCIANKLVKESADYLFCCVSGQLT
jgi:hypothetical protein